MKRVKYCYYRIIISQVTDQDITGLNIIAFRRINQMDVSGHVVTAQEHVNSLKVVPIISTTCELYE